MPDLSLPRREGRKTWNLWGCWLVEISTSATLLPSLVTCALAYHLFITTFLFFLSQKNSSSLCLLAKGVRILYLLTTSLYRRDWGLSSKSPLSPTFSWLASLTFEVTAWYFHIWVPALVVTMSMFLPPVPALEDCLASSFMPPAMFESMMRWLPLWWSMVRVMGFWAMLPLKQVGGTGAELVWGVDSVSGDINHLLSVLDNVKVDLELTEEEVPVVPVNEELEVVGPGLESAEGIVVLDEFVQL